MKDNYQISGKLPAITLVKLTLSTLALTSFDGFPLQANVNARLSETSQVSINSIGAVRVGMTIAEANRMAGVELVRRRSGGEPNCLYYKPRTGLNGVEFMVTGGRVSRIDITNLKVITISGAKVGDSESRIKSLYSDRIQVSPHKYVPRGHYLIFVPKDRQDKAYRVIFETDGQKVTRWRAGKLPEVEWIEGCL